MRKTTVLLAALTAAAAIAAGTASSHAASKYGKMKYSPPESPMVADAEKVRSMDDCMSYTANHVSRGHEADRSMFAKQFGQPTSAQGAVSTYSYDSYTNIMLDCSRSMCSCRCLGK